MQVKKYSHLIYTMKNVGLTTIVRIFTILFFIELVLGCSTSQGENEGQKELKPAALKISKPPASYADTLVIRTAAAVFYNPDSIQLAKIKAVNEQRIFESMAHDCFYQMKNAKLVLGRYWPTIKIIESSKARYLLFIKNSGSRSCIDLNEKNDMCGIILFDCKQEPVLIDMMNVDTALGFYFGGK